jgi:FkbM family methyltransferase
MEEENMVRYLLKEMIRPLYRHLKDKRLREFNKIYAKWGEYPRFSRVDGVEFLNYRFDIPDLPSFVWQFKELFVDEIYKFDSIHQEPIILDCGANIGTSCLYFKSIFPRAKIKAFEADRDIVDILQTNLSTNGIDDVEVIDRAVWIDDGGVEFSSEGADGGSIYGDDNLTKVDSIRLRDYLEDIRHIDMLKMDIEGAEYEVLRDCKGSLDGVKNLFVEYHSWSATDQKLSEILQIFEESGFRYHIESLTKRVHPFIDDQSDKDMDLQLNIFGVKR